MNKGWKQKIQFSLHSDGKMKLKRNQILVFHAKLSVLKCKTFLIGLSLQVLSVSKIFLELEKDFLTISWVTRPVSDTISDHPLQPPFRLNDDAVSIKFLLFSCWFYHSLSCWTKELPYDIKNDSILTNGPTTASDKKKSWEFTQLFLFAFSIWVSSTTLHKLFFCHSLMLSY